VIERRPHPSFPWCFADTDGHIYRGAELIKGHKSKAGYRVTPYGHAVSDMGRVKFPNGRVTFGRCNVYGYYVVDIQARRQQVHRLVAQRFLEAVDVPTIAHKDADRGNNRGE